MKRVNMNRDMTKQRNLVPTLQCQSCGNRERFFEVMRSEAHLVDGNLNYLQLMNAEADH
jgi:hypothetical protein